MGWWSNTQAANNKRGHYTLQGFGRFFRFLQDWIFFYLKQLLPLAGVVLLLLALSRVVQLPYF